MATDRLSELLAQADDTASRCTRVEAPLSNPHPSSAERPSATGLDATQRPKSRPRTPTPMRPPPVGESSGKKSVQVQVQVQGLPYPLPVIASAGAELRDDDDGWGDESLFGSDDAFFG